MVVTLASGHLTIHSRGTAIVPMSVPLTQALGAQNIRGNKCKRQNRFGPTG